MSEERGLDTDRKDANLNSYNQPTSTFFEEREETKFEMARIDEHIEPFDFFSVEFEINLLKLLKYFCANQAKFGTS